MNLEKIQKLLFTISLTMLVAAGMVSFALPSTPIANAQSGRNTGDNVLVCVNTTTANVVLATVTNGNGTCPDISGWIMKSVSKTLDKGICVSKPSSSGNVTVILPSDSGVTLVPDQNPTQCKKTIGTDPDGTAVVGVWSYKPLTSISGYNGNTNTNNNGNGNNTGNSNTNNNGNNNGNNGGGTTTGGGTTSQVQGDCDAGFHKVGPLCSPNSPFTTGIAGGDVDPAVLAVRIIKILLYFAGIVAVIMIIIGGYRVMTAQGNATQAADGRKTLTNALIGLAIVILAYIIVQAVYKFLIT